MNNAAFSKKYRYGFIGVGNMASAIISGLINTETVESDNIMMFDISDKNIAFFSSRGCVNASGSSITIVTGTPALSYEGRA